MAEDREQDQAEERDSAARPVTAAARRERRASASGTAPAGRIAERTPAKARPARTRKPAADDPETTESAKDTKGRATPKRDRKDKRPSVFARFFRFLREVIGELRKVIWPTRKQQLTYTVVVLVFVAVIVALVSGLDLLFAKGVFWVFA